VGADSLSFLVADRDARGISYSLYLIHILFVETLSAVLVKLAAPPIAWAVGCLVTIPVALATAYGFYLLVERPFLNPTFRETLDKNIRPNANESLLRGAVESTT
jgi:peptidoglycan/LPS O-acetylase OafA/YrhL